MLNADNLSKSFALSHKKVCTPLVDASFYIGEGEKVGILGKSGEGKTTIARIICGLTPPDGGNVYIDGAPLYDVKNATTATSGKPSSSFRSTLMLRLTPYNPSEKP